MLRFPLIITLLVLAIFACAVLALSSGAVLTDWRLAFAWWWPGFSEDFSALQLNVVTELRLPRLLLGLIVGAVLAQAGCAMQTLCRNPLADPSLIGIAAGAAMLALLVIAFGPQLGLSGHYWVSAAAFIGALVTSLLVYQLSRSSHGVNVATLLLCGVAINALAAAVIGLISYYASDDALRLMSFWQMGSLAAVTWQPLPMAFASLGLCSALLWYRRKAINLLLLGEQQARYLGVNVPRLKRELIVLVALGVGAAVALTGIIGFIGLVIPHIARLLVGAAIPRLMPVAMLLGALVLALADWLARMAVPPAELPIGIITALLGAPFFLYLLLQQKRRLYA
ncbi:hypothetical protein AEST_32700 [Alishewanella aestuarii B11]|uniref:Hemin ABC transporter permease n=1 Tax=Alishewanella aestuarii B11 TaxID=1197174 RepID=J1PYT5_9ALTE|nr:iron ABC transporter permease [Alishewanella aestuarii]EJI83873.1 hypothetical protein AEST_32700 [Alishewanella aestuarii B11]